MRSPRVQQVVHRAVDGLSADQLSARVDDDANSIAWLVWHLARVQDDHVAGVADTDQVWTADGWDDRFGLPFHADAIGYGQSSADVAKVQGLTADLLIGYHDAVTERTLDFVRGVTADDLATVVDEAWDPPVTMSVRMVSVVSDTLQHAGQAAFVRGMLLRS
jgi:uncharacterized damage-inducible protein DinB